MSPLRLDLVIRTSKRKQEARSPQQQRDIAYGCTSGAGHEIVTEHDSGESESGKTMDRSSLRALHRRVAAGETDGVIVAAIDRLGRAPIEESMAWVRDLKTVGGVLVVASMGGRAIDLADPVQETGLVMQLQFARQEWLTKAEGVKRSQRDAIAAGKFVGPTPFGYTRRDGRLYEHPEQGPLVREAYRLAARHGHDAAIDYLRGAHPARRWDSDSVRRLLKSRAYLGESRTGKLLNAAAHEPLVDAPVWAAAQTAARARRSNGDYPLTNLVTCANCGAGLVGAMQTVPGRKPTRRMRCSAVCKGGVGSVTADRLEAHVRGLAAGWVDESGWLASYAPTGKDAAEAALAAAEYDLAEFVDGVGGMAGDLIRRNIDKRQAAVDAARAELRVIADACARSEVLPNAAAVRADDEALAAVLRVGVDSGVVVTVAGGRGPIEGRVDVDGLEDGVGVLAA